MLSTVNNNNNSLISRLALLLAFACLATSSLVSAKMEKVGTKGKNYRVKKADGIVFCEYNGDFNIRTRSTSQWCGNTPTFWSFGNNGCTKYPGRIGLTDWKTKSKFTIKPVYKKNDPKPWYKIIAKNNCAAKYVTAEPGVGDLPLSFDQDTSTDGLFRIDAFDKTSNAADCVSDIYIISGQGEGFFLDSYCDEFEVTEDGPGDNSKWMVVGV